MNYDRIQMQLQSKGVQFSSGLSSKEIDEIESFYSIHFPPDLRDFLKTGLPVSNGFINWRDRCIANAKTIEDIIAWPLEGMLYDIEHNAFWYECWGDRPANMADALSVCKEAYKKVPQLIPIYSHRYIPSEPNETGNPVFSVYQTDIIYYGEDLLSYFEVEFLGKNQGDINEKSIRKIEFWSDMAC